MNSLYLHAEVIEVYCPSMLRYPKFLLRGRDSSFMNGCISSIMQDPLTTAASLAMAVHIRDKGLRGNAVGLYYRALFLLRRRLSSPKLEDLTSNSVLLSIIFLMSIEVSLHFYTSENNLIYLSHFRTTISPQRSISKVCTG
jgi:hypothetical protein